MVFRSGDAHDRDVLTVQGVVTHWSHGHATIEITMAGKPVTITAARSGRLVTRHIHIIEGDRVTVELSPYDLSRGRIIERERSKR